MGRGAPETTTLSGDETGAKRGGALRRAPETAEEPHWTSLADGCQEGSQARPRGSSRAVSRREYGGDAREIHDKKKTMHDSELVEKFFPRKK